MILQQAIADGLGEIRREAEARMTDTFEVRIYSGGWTYNKAQQKDVRQYDVLLTTPGRVKVGGGLAASDADVGGRASVEVRRELHVPIATPAIPVGAVAVCVQIAATSDPTLLGAELTLAGPAPGSQTTARRLQVTEVIA